MSLNRISLILLLVLLITASACSSKPKADSEAQPQPQVQPQPQAQSPSQSYSGEEEYLAARKAAQDASFAMMSISTCLSHYCKNNGPALDDEERLAKMMNKVRNPEASRAVQGLQYKEKLLTLYGYFKGQIDTFIVRSKIYREKLLAGGSLDQTVQSRVNGIDRDMAALGDIMGSWPTAEWACLVK